MRTCTYLDQHHLERCTECGVTLDLCSCPNVNDSAHHRLWGKDGRTIRIMLSELESARKEFPDNQHLLCTLMERIGKLAQAIMEHDRGQGTTTQQVYREAIQAASIAIRVAVDGDQNFLYESSVALGD